MKNLGRLFLFLVAAVVSVSSWAARSYSCDFEDEAQRARWTINPAASQKIFDLLKNKWYFGADGNNGINGQYGLYISDDNGTSAHYTASSCFVFAYDTVTLDHLSTAGNYQLSFEYRGMGNVSSNFDGLYAFWIPVINPDTGDSIKVMSIPTSASEIPSAYSDYVIQLDPIAKQDYLGATQTWKQCLVTLKNSWCDGKPHYLAFAWANGSDMEQQPGGCIDNIEITDDRQCDAPTNLEIALQGSTCVMTWEGETNRYEVSAFSYEQNKWYGPVEVNGKTYTFGGLPAGQTDFVVRSKCADDLLSLKTMKTILVYYPDEMCVDYLNLNNAKCYISTSNVSNTSTFNAFALTKPVDFGPAAKDSRHTIHFDKQEYDPRTGGELKTIPDGELASIRLGNWNNGAEAERIEFTFTVDSINFPVLLLKYAVVIEAPGHGPNDDPRFKLQILQGNTSLGSCSEADFNANDVYNKTLGLFTNDKTWHFTPSTIARAGGASGDLVWKDWTTVGVNLSKYHGKKLTIRLTTLDCTVSGHAGYAYFTIGCSDGKLKGIKCGVINPVFEAPDGFNYRWMYAADEQYREADGNMPEQYVRGHEQKFEAGYQDDNLYAVDCMFVQDSSCYFTLYASTLATNPIPVMSKPVITQNCREGKYSVQFDASQSYVEEINHITGDTAHSSLYGLDILEWNFGDGRHAYEPSPVVDFPSGGGTWNVTLYASQGTCDSVASYTLHLDEISDVRDTVIAYLCDADKKASGYQWSAKPDTAYFTYGMDSIRIYNQATSCDSIIYLDLREPIRIMVDSVVFDEQLPVTYHGRQYNGATIDTIPSANCDTAWVFDLGIYEVLNATLRENNYILCEGDSVIQLEYTITKGRSSYYSQSFANAPYEAIERDSLLNTYGNGSIEIDVPDIKPNVYEGILTLHDAYPDKDVKLPFTLTVNYNSSVIMQRWNDVLAIRNSAYNGGYEFNAYQWYKNEEPIEGATDSYYSTPANEELDFSAEYSVQVTRVSDGVILFTCPFQPTRVSGKENIPSLVNINSTMKLPGRGNATWVNTIGWQQNAGSFDNSSIPTPGLAGIYLLLLTDESGVNVYRVMVR